MKSGIIGAVIGVLSTVLAGVLILLIKQLIQRQPFRKDLSRIRDWILAQKPIDLADLGYQLYEMRELFHNNPRQMKKKKYKQFFEKWLDDWTIAQQDRVREFGFIALQPNFDRAKVGELVNDLQKLNL